MTVTPLADDAYLMADNKEANPFTGRIQPFGLLLTVEPEQLTIQNISENSLKLWDRHSFALLGRSLAEFLTAQALAELKSNIRQSEDKVLLPLNLLITFDEYIKRQWEVRVHHHQGLVFLECEAAEDPSAASEIRHGPLNTERAIHALQSARSLQEVCEQAASLVRAITGFGRVVVYRFNHEWLGEGIAESLEAGMTSGLGQPCLASDIPAQVRTAFHQTRLRLIPDVDYKPARIYPNEHPQTGEALDLSKAVLRSGPEYHLAYLRQIGVKASLSIALTHEEKLWGVIACHHVSPLMVNPDTRSMLERIGQLVSSRLAAKNDMATP